jgi:hypothetical protein
MTWWQFAYVVVSIASGTTAAAQLKDGKVNFWAMLLVVTLWPLALAFGLYRQLKGEKRAKTQETGSSVPDRGRRH